MPDAKAASVLAFVAAGRGGISAALGRCYLRRKVDLPQVGRRGLLCESRLGRLWVDGKQPSAAFDRHLIAKGHVWRLEPII